MHSTTWPAIITLLNIALQFWTSVLVAQARGKYGVKVPATTGNADFERVFRVQMNTMEASLLFLPALWLAALYGTPTVVAIAGLVWIGGRVLYALGYMREAAKRSMGFGIASLGFGALALDATIGLVRSLIA